MATSITKCKPKQNELFLDPMSRTEISATADNNSKEEEEGKFGLSFFEGMPKPNLISSEICDSYMRGCQWSPDGLCILTNCDDNVVRIYDLPSEKIMKPSLEIKEAECVYDSCWFPLMDSKDPDTCCLVTTSRYQPIHLHDGYTGTIRATYRCYNRVDEVCTAHSICFDPDGRFLYAGLKGEIKIFDVSVPGRDCLSRLTASSFDTSARQRGIISALAVNPTLSKIYAAGSFDRTVAIYAEPTGEPLVFLRGQTGGVTQVKFTSDGTKLLVGGRKDDEILVWDLRNPGTLLFVLNRRVTTNQRVSFDINSNDRYVISGNSDASVKVWDLTQPPVDVEGELLLPHIEIFESLHDDCVNGVSFHPSLPIFASTSGQRHFPDLSDDNNESSSFFDETSVVRDYSTKIWNCLG